MCIRDSWYPVRDIGEVKCATEKGACNLEKTEKGAFVGFYSVKKRNCVITLLNGENVIACLLYTSRCV